MYLIFVVHGGFAWNSKVIGHQSTMMSVTEAQLSAQASAHSHALAMFFQYLGVYLNPVTRAVEDDQVLFYCDAG